MIIWTAQDAQKATGCKLLGAQDWEAMSICIDSRLVKKGDLFVALKGTKTDGHDYIREAFLKGAAAVMVERVPQNFSQFSPIMLVDNCIDALYGLALYRRIESTARIIAVTGSVGKTSTKDMLNIAFSHFGLTHYSFGNNNNEIGAPLSMARMPKDSEFGIFELGMNHSGEISPLSKLVRPSIAIITTVAEVHIENFRSLQDIAAAKAEIFDGMDRDGTAILNTDNEFFEFLFRKARAKKLRTITFGESENADIRLIDHKDKLKKSFIHASIMGKEIGFEISARGKHMALNALAALAAIDAAGLDIEEAAASLAAFSASAGRGQISHIKIDDKNVTLIDDSYNASPLSMRTAIESLGAIETKGRRIAVIGDMLELGEKSLALHLALESDILRNHIDKVFTLGENSRQLLERLPKKIQGEAFSTIDPIIDALKPELKNDDVVLIKSSHGTGLYKLADKLTKFENRIKEDAV